MLNTLQLPPDRGAFGSGTLSEIEVQSPLPQSSAASTPPQSGSPALQLLGTDETQRVAQETTPAAPEPNVSWKKALIALAMAIGLQSIPWWDILYGQMPNEDLENYLLHPTYATMRLERVLNDDFISLVTHEPLWLYCNHMVAINGLPLDLMVQVASVVFWFSVTFYFLAHNVPPWFLFFLVNPYFIDLTTIHSRQALSVALLMLGETLGLVASVLTALIAPMLHTSAALFAGCWLYRRGANAMPRFRVLTALLLLACVYASVHGMNLIMAQMGDFRSNYAISRTDSGLYAVPWFIGTVALLFDERLRSHGWMRSAYIVFAVAAFSVSSGGGFRMVEGAFPFLIVSAHRLTRRNVKVFVLLALAAFQVVQFIYKYRYMYV